MSFRAVTYWAGQSYKIWADNLALSAQAVGVPLTVHAAEDTGDWQANTLLKPNYILEALESGKEDVVWLDADCSVLKYPELFHKLDGANVGLFVEGPDLCSINGSVSFFRNNDWTKKLLVKWKEWNLKRNEHADDHNLLCALNDCGMQYMAALPPAYCWNERLMRHRFPGADPVIEMHLVHMLRDK